MLKPAGLLRRVLGGLIPARRVTAKVIATATPEGHLRIAPAYYLDGEEVPAEASLTGSDLLGHRFFLDDAAKALFAHLRREHSTIPANQAVAVIQNLKTKRVPVIARDGVDYVVEAGRFSGIVKTSGKERADVSTKLIAENGRTIPQATPVPTPGVVVTDRGIVTSTCGTEVDAILSHSLAGTSVEGDSLAKVVKAIRSHPKQLGDVVLSDDLRSSQVFDEKVQKRVTVTGSEDYVTLDESLVFQSREDTRVAPSVEQVKEAIGLGRRFLPVPDGWVDAQAIPAGVMDRVLPEAPVRVEGERIPEVLDQLAELRLPWQVDVVLRPEVERHHHVHRTPPKHAVYVAGDEDHVEARTEAVFDHDVRVPLGDLVQTQRAGKKYKRVPGGWAKLDAEALHAAENAAQRIAPGLEDVVHATGQQIPELLQTLKGRSHWDVYVSRAVEGAHRVVDEKPHWRFHLGVYSDDSGSGLTLSPAYDQGRFQVDAQTVLEAARAGDRWIRRGTAWLKLDAGSTGSVDDALGDDRFEKHGDEWRFSARDRDAVLGLFSRLGTVEQTEAYNQFLLKLREFERIEDAPLPKALRGSITPRSYQLHGYNWLCFLEEYWLNGVLADDMGLGKTLQTLMAISRSRERRTPRLPSLIVCPTSVVRNWKDEAEKFFSNVYAVTYLGPEKARQRLLSTDVLKADVVITSYGIASRDHEELNRVQWRYLVLDEAHYIKNPDAERTKALKTINARAKLALTGTPVQNRVEELWSLFDLLMPGFLGKRGRFLTQYGKVKIEDDNVADTFRPLRERVHPFIMRRLKSEVAKDLPPKLIIERPAELTPKQSVAYKLILGREDVQKMLKAVSEGRVQQAKLHILQAYAALRKICNHPGLLEGSGKLPVADSGKLASLHELLEEVEDGDHRALIFSQSTEMLNVIEAHLPDWGHRYLRLDGSTPAAKRPELVAQYNGDPAIRCFLISTGAGGTGLNLTGADTVIFYDHDWNPANDRQAEDRAYRIGQTRQVTVYRLITTGTIEEKIIKRQAAKLALAEALVSVDEEGFKDISRDDLLELFRLDEQGQQS